MTGALGILFVIFFIGGPLIFRALTHKVATARSLRMIVILTAFCVTGGLFIRFGLPDLWGRSLWVTGAGILVIWFAWIGVLAFVALSLRRKDPSIRMRHWTAITGALCTTVPWFGLASANLVQG